MRPKIVVANWKMHKTLSEGVQLVAELVQKLAQQPSTSTQIILLPSFVHLASVGQLLQHHTQLLLGAQHCHHQSFGAFTGEVSAAMLRAIGSRFVLVGHSERRQYFREAGSLLAQKASSILMHDQRPIFCCGEDQGARSSSLAIDAVTAQLEEGLFHLSPTQMSSVIIAYEPVWAIGTGESLAPEQVQLIHSAIRGVIARKYDDSVARCVPILYGGSCSGRNARLLFAQPDVDGGLIGRASLEADAFLEIVNAF